MDIKTKYNGLNEDLKKKISLLSKKLNRHKKQFKQDPGNWGFVGDLGYVNEKLDEVLSFMKVN